jgi:protein Tex
MITINSRLAAELQVKEHQVAAAVALLDEGSSVPFISRYRKEATDGLDDGQLRTLDERLRYLRELDERRQIILKSIEEQGKLSSELKRDINAAETKTLLEDLYLPYKKKRRTKAQIAREAGLEPLALQLLDQPELDPQQTAEVFVNPEQAVADVKAALEGAKHILMERFSEDALLLGRLRNFLKAEGYISAAVVAGKEQEGAKFRDYFEHTELLAKMPSHRALAIFRARKEGIVSVAITLAPEKSGADEKPVKSQAHPCEAMVAEHWQIRNEGRAADSWLQEVVRWTWRIKLLTHLELELLNELRERAELKAINVFGKNLKDLLLAAPAGRKVTVGLDPGLRTGVKVAVVDETGKLLDYDTIYPTPPQKRVLEAEVVLLKFCKMYGVTLVAIGNGTGSRETDKFVGDMLKANPEMAIQKVIVNEAGASIYSASEFAAQEFPELDVTIRGAVSIARRLQDPLAELVKIDPKSIGVGQYQHDVSQVKLARSLDAVVEDCVNGVGVDLNTASSPLLAKVSGLNQSLANNIVSFREQHGAFDSRSALMQVSRFGDKSFEQAAGFLRVNNGENPLDASGVHPESYAVVERISSQSSREIKGLIGDGAFLRSLKAENFCDDTFGLPTVTDIIAELEKPGRDPRPEFKMARLQEGVETLKDLQSDMVLEGTITNVTNFGAFVDIGVHQDGLVHISMLADKFVRDPHTVVKAGDIVKVKVMEVDSERKRISLSMRLTDRAEDQLDQKASAPRKAPAGKGQSKKGQQKKQGSRSSQQMNKAAEGTMAALLKQAGVKR